MTPRTVPAFSHSNYISMFHFEMHPSVHYIKEIICELSLLGVGSLTSRQHYRLSCIGPKELKLYEPPREIKHNGFGFVHSEDSVISRRNKVRI